MSKLRVAACAAVIGLIPTARFALADNPPAEQTQARHKMSADQMIGSWPQTCQKAFKEIKQKYGEPDGVTPTRMVWTDKGPNKEFKEIILLNQEFKHDFPTPHMDCLEHVVEFKVPQDKVGDLAKFDGSVIVDRTRGTIGARCDSEAHNLIALNLSWDIVNGKTSVEDARKTYGDAVKEEMGGKPPQIATKLMFQPMQNSGDTDVATIGASAGEAQPAAEKQEK